MSARASGRGLSLLLAAALVVLAFPRVPAADGTRAATRPLGRIDGVLLAESGEPLAGAALEARPRPAEDFFAFDPPFDLSEALPVPAEPVPVASRATSGEDGTFALDGLAPGTWYEVVVRPRAPHVPTRLSARADVLPTYCHVARLVRGRPVRLRITDGRGRPIQGVVRLQPGGTAGSPRASLPHGASVRWQIDAPVEQGVSDLAAVPPEVSDVRVLVPGRQCWLIHADLESAAEVRLVLGGPSGATVAGRVVEVDRKGISDARVRVLVQVGGPTAWMCASAVTSPDGSFHVPDLPTSGRLVGYTVQAAGYLERTSWSEGSDLGAGTTGTDALEVALDREASLRGVVRDEQGAPVPGAEVVVEPTDRTGGRYVRRPVRTTSGRDGVYVLRGQPPGRGVISAVAPGFHWAAFAWLPAHGAPYEVDEPGREVTTDLVLRPAATVAFAGRCVDERGAPVAGAVVTWERDWAAVRVADADPLRFDVRTDAAGAYRFPPTKRDAGGRISARTAELGYASSEDDEPGSLQGATLRLRPLPRLGGRVLDERGCAVPRVRIEVSVLGFDWDNVRTAAAVLSDAEGRFTVRGLTPGTYAVSVDDASWTGTLPLAKSEVQLEWGRVAQVELKARPVRPVLSGRLRTASGEPSAWTRLSFLAQRRTALDGGPLSGRETSRAEHLDAACVTRGDGSFRVFLTGDALYDVFDGADYLAQRIEPGAGPLDARRRAAPLARRFTRWVRDAHGNAVAYAWVSGEAGGDEGSATPDLRLDAGLLTADWQSSTTWSKVWITEPRDAYGRLLAAGDFRTDEPPDAWPDPIVLPEDILRGRVVDAAGTGIGGVVVRLPIEARGFEGVLGEDWDLTGPEGLFRLPRASGRAHFDVYAPPPWQGGRMVGVHDESAGEVLIQLAEAR